MNHDVFDDREIPYAEFFIRPAGDRTIAVALFDRGDGSWNTEISKATSAELEEVIVVLQATVATLKSAANVRRSVEYLRDKLTGIENGSDLS